MIVILAHGALGWFDELIFLGIIVIFLGMVVFAWFRSRGENFSAADLMPPSETKADEERFTLE